MAIKISKLNNITTLEIVGGSVFPIPTGHLRYNVIETSIFQFIDTYSRISLSQYQGLYTDFLDESDQVFATQDDFITYLSSRTGPGFSPAGWSALTTSEDVSGNTLTSGSNIFVTDTSSPVTITISDNDINGVLLNSSILIMDTSGNATSNPITIVGESGQLFHTGQQTGGGAVSATINGSFGLAYIISRYNSLYLI